MVWCDSDDPKGEGTMGPGDRNQEMTMQFVESRNGTHSQESIENTIPARHCLHMKQITILLNEVDVLRPINVLQGLVGSEHDAPRGHVSIVIDTSYLVPPFWGRRHKISFHACCCLTCSGFLGEIPCKSAHFSRWSNVTGNPKTRRYKVVWITVA